MPQFHSKLLFGVSLAMLLTLAPSIATADLYTGSGGSFGGAVGGSSMDWTDDGTTISVNFTKGTGGGFNNTFVLYLDTGVTGRNTIGTQVNDRNGNNRSSVSFMYDSTGKTLTLPSSFQASHAISINTSFGQLWSIPATGSIGDNGLGYITDVGKPSNSSATSFTFSFDLANIGLAPDSGAEVKFVATYLDPFGGAGNLGFASNEGYGSGFPGGHIGQDDFSFTGSPLSYVTAVPEPSAFLFGGLVCTMLGMTQARKRRRS